MDIAVADKLQTAFFVSPPQGKSDYLREIVQYPHMLFGVSDGGAHTKFLTAGRYPTETLTNQVATSMITRINSIAAGPITGRPFDLCVSTGDNIDNQQHNKCGACEHQGSMEHGFHEG